MKSSSPCDEPDSVGGGENVLHSTNEKRDASTRMQRVLRELFFQQIVEVYERIFSIAEDALAVIRP